MDGRWVGWLALPLAAMTVVGQAVGMAAHWEHHLVGLSVAA
jgi:hypothetical protein